MKKLFVASVLALGVTMACQQTASAWSEFKFSAGVNLGWVGGGNRVLWGLYHSAPYPGGQDVYPVFPGVAAALGYHPEYGGGGYGGYDSYAAAPGAANYGGMAAQAPVAPLAPMAPAAAAGAPQTYNPYYNTGYQPVGYSYPGYATYPVPAYWYGR